MKLDQFLCKHEPVDTGFRKIWCKICNLGGVSDINGITWDRPKSSWEKFNEELKNEEYEQFSQDYVEAVKNIAKNQKQKMYDIPIKTRPRYSGHVLTSTGWRQFPV